MSNSLPLPLLQLSIASLLGLQVQLEVVHLRPHLGCLLPHLVQVALEVILLTLRVHQLKGCAEDEYGNGGWSVVENCDNNYMEKLVK